MRSRTERGLLVILLALLALFGGDWAVYRFRSAHGSGLDSVKVNTFLSVPLKNGKEELDYVSSEQVACVRSLFPWGGREPCWWVRRHQEKRIAM